MSHFIDFEGDMRREQATKELATFAKRLQETRQNGTDEEYQEAYGAYGRELEKYFNVFRVYELPR